MYLVDTNVISEARKARRADPGVQAFFAAAIRDDTPLCLAAVTVGELRRGVELIRHALLHDLTVVTRNTADFAGCGLRLMNPFAIRGSGVA